MTDTMRQSVRRHGALVSAVTAALVGLAMAAQFVAQALIGFVGALPYLAGGFYAFGAERVLLIALPFAVGYFLSLWLIAPIAQQRGIGLVVARAVLVTVVASGAVFIVQAAVAIVSAFPMGPWMPDAWFSADTAVTRLGFALSTALQTLVEQLPLGVLGGVLLWLWRRDHPPRHPLAGIIDEV